MCHQLNIFYCIVEFDVISYVGSVYATCLSFKMFLALKDAMQTALKDCLYACQHFFLAQASTCKYCA